jgi:hypothetical protein
MATVDVSRKVTIIDGTNTISFIADMAKDNVASGDTYIVGKLPAGMAVTRAYIRNVTASDAATSKVASVIVGATAVASAIDLKAAAGTIVAEADAIAITTADTNVTFSPTTVGAETVKGKFVITLEVVKIQ